MPNVLARASVRRTPRKQSQDRALAPSVEAASLEATSLEATSLDAAALARRLAGLAAIQPSLARLRALGSVSEMLDQVTAEVCGACGFDRSLLFRVEGSELVIESAHFAGDPDAAAAVLQVARDERPQIGSRPLEAEMLRRRTPLLVVDPENDPRTYKPLIGATRTTSFVGAPVMPQGRAIGFLHADCLTSGRTVDELDRWILGAFAEGFGYAVERAILLERLRAQRDQMRALVRSTEAAMDDLCDADVELLRERVDDGDEIAARRRRLHPAPSSGLRALLTRRELEVLELMAEGMTNAAIGQLLVISEGTVKSHVKHILRKLRAANRADAVSRFMRMTGHGDARS